MSDFSPHIIRERRKTISLQIKPDATVVVKAPYLVPEFMINRFIKEKEAWIRAKLRMVQQFPQPTNRTFEEGETFFYLGKEYALKIAHITDIKLDDALYFPFKNKRSIKKKLLNWYKENALETISKRVEEYAQLMNVTYTQIGLSNAKKRWGACSHKDDLTFNWRLIMAPVHIIDYVVIHELAHTIEKNHSKQFWEIVRKYCPDFKVKRRWLNTRGNAFEI